MKLLLKASTTPVISPRNFLQPAPSLSPVVKNFLLALLLQVSLTASADDELPYVEIITVKDFSQLAKTAHDEDKIIMLEVSASYCTYCELLEEEFIKPMLRSGDYNDVLIRKIEMDSDDTIKDFSGKPSTPEEFTHRLKVRLTPTLLFFDGRGHEISPRILGINSLDLYGWYLDEAIKFGLQKIKSQ